MSKSIFNGGIELALLELFEKDELTPEQQNRKKYLKSLPQNQWIHLDKNGMAMTDEQHRDSLKKELSRFKVIKEGGSDE